MIFFYTLLIIFLLIIILMFCPLKITIMFNNHLYLSIRFLFLSFKTSFRNFKGELIYESKIDSPKTTDKFSENQFNLFEFIKEKKVISLYKKYRDIFIIILNSIRLILKKMHFDYLFLNITITSEDAAETALTYGKTCTLINSVWPIFQRNLHIKKCKINIVPKFNDNSESNVIFKTKFYFIPALSIKTLIISLVNVYKCLESNGVKLKLK